MSSFTVISAVVCEDVRREASGQATIVGASPVGPPVNREGDVIRSIAFFIEMLARQVSELDMRLVDEDGKNTVFERSLSLPVEVEQGEMDWELHTLMVLSFSDLKVPHPGSYLLQGKKLGGEWENVRSVIFPEDIED